MLAQLSSANHWYKVGVRVAMAVLVLTMMFAFTPGMPVARMQGNPTPAPDTNLQGLYLGTSFSDLTFSTTPTGLPMTFFPAGTTEIYARWNYHNVPYGTTVRREWYRNGVLFIDRQEAWSYFITGTVTSVSIYDFTDGLEPGNYFVRMSLLGNFPAAVVVGEFVVGSAPVPIPPVPGGARFADLTVSTTAAGSAASFFPAGTRSINARWNYSNIPVGAIFQRDWYLNGLLLRSVQEPWSAYWGPNGRLTHVALYDYTNGLTPGNWSLVVFLRDNPAVRVQTSWVIGAGIPNASFSNLTFSTQPNGLSSFLFPRGTPQVFARWDYRDVPAGSVVRRTWYRNGVLWLRRDEAWLRGGNGTVTDVSIYDWTNGLLPGGYYVEIELVGAPGSTLRGSFNIQ